MEFKGSMDYSEVFIFENREVLDSFVCALELSESSLEEDFLAHDIKIELASTTDDIRIIRSYEFGKIEDDIKGMCEFIDIDSFEDKKDDISHNRLVVKIYDMDKDYREVFYCL